MNKLVLLLPLFFITMCGEAPVTPPAQACSLPLSGLPAYCPDPNDKDLILVKPKDVKIPREAAQGEIDITNPHHWQSLQLMFQRNVNKGKIEKNATLPSDAINSALDDFWEVQQEG